MRIKIQSLVLFSCLTGLFISCAKAPEQKLAVAKEAIDNAKAAGAVEYAKSEFTRARDYYYSAFNDIQDEKGRFLFIRNYRNADNKLDSTIYFARKATKTAEIVKLRIEAEKSLAIEWNNSFKAKYVKNNSAVNKQDERKNQTH
jgi:hypothetical protein